VKDKHEGFVAHGLADLRPVFEARSLLRANMVFSADRGRCPQVRTTFLRLRTRGLSMATLPKKPFRMAPLQRLTVKPIEDPTERAALDERIKRSEEARAHDSTSTAIKKGLVTLPSKPTGAKPRKRRR
jgi:hypothetical protein